MIVNKIILLVTFCLSGLVLSHYDIELNKLSNEGGHAKNYYAKILKSLVNLNEERVGNLKRLYLLNSHYFGKEPLRSYINNAEDYDDLIKSIKVILNELNNNEISVPNYPYIYRTHNLNVRKRKKYHLNRNVKQLAEDSKSDDITDKTQRILRFKSNEDDKSISEETTSEVGGNRKKRPFYNNISSDSSSEIGGNKKNESLRYYYYYYYTCDDSRERCKRSCKDAYRYVCYEYHCSDGFRREMRRSCSKACRKWFDD